MIYCHVKVKADLISDSQLLPRGGRIFKDLPLAALFSQPSLTYSFDSSYLIPCIKITYKL